MLDILSQLLRKKEKVKDTTNMKTLLLTGFGPFAENTENPTETLVKNFDNLVINNHKIISHILPVEYEKSIHVLDGLIERTNPDVIINLGLASNREEITPELISINYQHSETKDNAGVTKKFSRINPSGKESFFSTLPNKEMIENINLINGTKAKLSSTAGTYVCNTVMYHCLKKTQQDKRNCRSGFIHIPPNIAQEDLTQVLTACIKTL